MRKKVFTIILIAVTLFFTVAAIIDKGWWHFFTLCFLWWFSVRAFIDNFLED